MSALALMGVVGAAGCTGSSSPASSPSATSPGVPPSASPTVPAAEQLQQVAGLGAKAVFRATYVVRQKHPSSRATWRVWRTSNSLRLDVVTKHATATLIQTPHNTYACSRSGSKKTCFRVTKGGTLPAPLRLLAAQLFSANVESLAKGSTNRFTVSTSTTGGSNGTCFAVQPRHKNSALRKATYCFNDSGVLTRVQYTNGNLVRAQHIATEAPKGNLFHPYSSPTPIPG